MGAKALLLFIQIQIQFEKLKNSRGGNISEIFGTVSRQLYVTIKCDVPTIALGTYPSRHQLRRYQNRQQFRRVNPCGEYHPSDLSSIHLKFWSSQGVLFQLRSSVIALSSSKKILDTMKPQGPPRTLRSYKSQTHPPPPCPPSPNLTLTTLLEPLSPPHPVVLRKFKESEMD